MEAFVKNKVESSSCYSAVHVTKMYLVLFIVPLKFSQGAIFGRRKWENINPWDGLNVLCLHVQVS